MPYHFTMAYANISSLHARQEDLNQKFFIKIVNNPDNPLFDLLPPAHDAAIIGRSAHLLPVQRTRTTDTNHSYIWFNPLPTTIKINHPPH